MIRPNVVLWRHGQTDYNRDLRIQGQIDIPLNETGIAQAQRSAQVLAAMEPAAIITSDLSRAMDTGVHLAELTGLEMIVDERLRERDFGAWEGLTREEIQAGWPEEYEKYRDWGQPEGVNVESRSDLGVRFGESVAEWASKFETSNTLVYVAHGAAIATGVTYLLGQDPDDWRGIAGLSNCHWTTLEAAAGAPEWRLTGHNVGP